jgi:hypothetical protein
MTSFFLPRLAPGDPGTERAYKAICAQAEAATGFVTRKRRILEVQCRNNGADMTLRVGELDESDGRIVEAILQLGRSVYTIHHADGASETATHPTVLMQSAVYSVTEFD